jgi:chemotaxis signal transduction protein
VGALHPCAQRLFPTNNASQLESGTMSTRPANDFDALDLTAGLGSDQYLTFILAGEEYGVNILRVQEIKGWNGVTEIPNTPDYVQGVVNLRGTIVPIVDLRRCFGINTVDYDKTTVVIMLKVTGQAWRANHGLRRGRGF